MATKYGEQAWRALAGMKAAFKARRNLVIGILVVVIIYVALDHYVF